MVCRHAGMQFPYPLSGIVLPCSWGNDILFGMVAIKKRNGFAADDTVTFMALLEKVALRNDCELYG